MHDPESQRHFINFTDTKNRAMGFANLGADPAQNIHMPLYVLDIELELQHIKLLLVEVTALSYFEFEPLPAHALLYTTKA
jgi:hypothetical protein